MSGSISLELSDQQEAHILDESFLSRMEGILSQVAARLLEEFSGSVLANLSELGFVLLDDEEMARVHGEFLHDATTTDVITFDHGEILIGVEVAWRQSQEFGNSPERELVLYGIHGLLHLAGYNDLEEGERSEMWTRQEALLDEFFPSL